MVIYEENHSFDNLYGGWEGVNGVPNADAAHTTQVNQAGAPYTCLKQSDLNLRLALAADVHGLDGGAGVVRQRLLEQPVHDRRLHRARRHDLPAEPAGRVQQPERMAERQPGSDRAAAPVTSSTASITSSTSSMVAGRTATSRAATPRV